MPHDESRLLGCVYVDPSTRRGWDAEVSYWARPDEPGLEDELGEFVRGWIEREWPFARVAYPGLEIPWSEWLAPAPEPREWVERYRVAWETADAHAAADLFTEDAEYRSHPFREPFCGRDEIAAYWTRATGSLREARVRMGRPFVDGERVAVEWWARLRDEEDGEVTIPGCLLLRVDLVGSQAHDAVRAQLGHRSTLAERT